MDAIVSTPMGVSDPVSPQGTNGGDSSGGSHDAMHVASRSGSSSALFHWELLCFFALWVFACIVLVSLISRRCSHCRRNQRDATSSPKQPEPSEDDVETAVETEPSVVGDDKGDSCSRQPIRIIMILSTMVALCLSILVHTSCHFLDAAVEESGVVDSMGLWKAASHERGVCYGTSRVPYDQAEDTSQVVARVTAVMATALGGIATLFSMASPWWEISPTETERFRRHALFMALLLVEALQAISIYFTAVQLCPSADSCSLGFGGLAAITAVVYWGLAALCLCLPW
jgi:hypothetical protein